MLHGLVLLVGLALANVASAQTFEIESADGTICAAFAYDSNLIATAAHCALDDRRFRVMGVIGTGTARLYRRGMFEGRYLTENERTGQDAALLYTDMTLPKPARKANRDARIGELVQIEPPGVGVRTCTVLAQQGNAFDLACEVRDGWSGAPVYVTSRLGGRFLIGIISGRIGQAGDGMAVMVHAQTLESLRR